MAEDIRVVSTDRHLGKRWRKPAGYFFAAESSIVAICTSEVALASHAMPLAFAEIAGALRLVAFLSPIPSKNLFVAPNGSWLGSYIPVLFRAYPFKMAQDRTTGQLLFAIDENVGIVSGDEPGTEPFFEAGNNLSSSVQFTIKLLATAHQQMGAADRAVAALNETGMIEPWPISVKTAGGEQETKGLHRISETKLNQASDDVFLKLRSAGALPIAYAQLFSMSQTQVFAQLAKIHAEQGPTQQAAVDTLDRIFGMSGDDTIRFD